MVTYKAGGKAIREEFTVVYDCGDRFVIFQDYYTPEAWEILANVLDAILPGSSEQIIAALKGDNYKPFRCCGRTVTIKLMSASTIWIEIK